MKNGENRLMKAALFYAEKLGWPVFPCQPRGKVPLTEHGFKDASTDPKQIREWWTKWPKANIGVPTGEDSGIWVLDVDEEKGGGEALLELEEEHGKLPETWESLTGAGRHLCWRYPEGRRIPNRVGIAEGLDVRGEGGYIVVPPSIHPSGKVYEWEVSSVPTKIPLADAPGWLVDLVVEKGRKAGQAPPLPDPLEEGYRNAMLASLAGSMRRRGASEQAILAALREENRLRCHPPLDEREIEHIAKSISRYEPEGMPKPIPEDEPIADLEAERMMVAALLADPTQIHDVAMRIPVGGVYGDESRKLYEVMVRLDKEGKPVNAQTVAKEAGLDEAEVEGIADRGIGENAAYFAEAVWDMWVRRKVMREAKRIASMCWKSGADEVLEAYERSMIEVARVDERAIQPISVQVREAIERLEKLGRGEIPLLPTGFPTLDRVLMGIRPQQFVILAGRTSHGKSVFTQNVMFNMAKAGYRVLMFSYEMAAVDYVTRQLAAEGGVHYDKLKTGALDDDDWSAVTLAAGKIGELPITIVDCVHLKLSQMLSVIRREKAVHPDLVMVAVDYMQEVVSDDPRLSRYEAMTEVSQRLKRVARELDVAVWGVSQLNRAIELRGSKEPVLSDLRESGNLEQDSDIVMFVQRPWLFDYTEEKNLSRIYVRKNREGDLGTVELIYDLGYMRFKEVRA